MSGDNKDLSERLHSSDILSSSFAEFISTGGHSPRDYTLVGVEVQGAFNPVSNRDSDSPRTNFLKSVPGGAVKVVGYEIRFCDSSPRGGLYVATGDAVVKREEKSD